MERKRFNLQVSIHLEYVENEETVFLQIRYIKCIQALFHAPWLEINC